MLPTVYFVERSVGLARRVVAAYLDKEQAELHVKTLMDEVTKCRRWEEEGSGTGWVEDWQDPWQYQCPYDPQFDYSPGLIYVMSQMPLVRHIDEWMEEVS